MNQCKICKVDKKEGTVCHSCRKIFEPLAGSQYEFHGTLECIECDDKFPCESCTNYTFDNKLTGSVEDMLSILEQYKNEQYKNEQYKNEQYKNEQMEQTLDDLGLSNNDNNNNNNKTGEKKGYCVIF